MRRGFVCAAGALLLGVGMSHVWVEPGEAHASGDRTRAQVITRDAPLPERPAREQVRHVPIGTDRPDGHATLVLRRVVEPAATVSRELSDQPVRPHMAEVVLGGIRNKPRLQIYVDPEQNLRRSRGGGLDENHSLVRAQRLWHDRHARPARVLRRPEALREPEPREAIRPRAVIPTPTQIEPEVPHRHRAIPSVPRPPRGQEGASMVRID